MLHHEETISSEETHPLISCIMALWLIITWLIIYEPVCIRSHEASAWFYYNSKASSLCYCYNIGKVAILLWIYGMQAKSTLYFVYVPVHVMYIAVHILMIRG